MTYLLLRLLPKNLFSRIMGRLADAEIPAPLLHSFIRFYSSFYSVNLDEVESSSLKEFKTFNQFFTRRLKASARPIDSDPDSVVSPVDGRIAEFGPIENGLLVQTKGILYSINDLIGGKLAESFADGFFLTLYLSPADYHRIHTPASGKVSAFSYFSGNLWPVNSFGVANIGGLFSINERIVTPLETKNSLLAIVKIGATVVGKIKIDYSDLCSNCGEKTQLHLPVSPPKTYGKGDEIGRFQLGSTVILLFEKGKFSPQDLQKGKSVKVGQVIGKFQHPATA